MGYACPVCAAPQVNAEHLANHLAFTAIVHGDDHETWLDDHVPDWESTNADGLGPLVADHAAEREFDEVFEDTVDRTDGHDHGHEMQQFGGHGESQSLSGDAARIFDEAKDLTREMYDRDEADAETASDEPPADDEKES